MMAANNQTFYVPVNFILTGIPGTEESHTWISIPFCMVYLGSLLGNSLLLFIIVTEQSLHEPMYLLLSMLAAADLLLSNTTMPKMLAVFWFRDGDISFAACLTQMFLIHCSFLIESGILLAMAFDRYVAICDPLRYTTILTKLVIGKIGLAVVTRSFCIIFPVVFLVMRLKFCRTIFVPHTYCKYMAISRLACEDITVNFWYGIIVAILVISLDALLIAVSYVLILRAVFQLPSKDARLKALRTCNSHVCVILMFYTPSFFSNVAYQFAQIIPSYMLNLLANLNVLVPPMLNPIIYGVTTKEILKYVKKVFYRGCKGGLLLN
ncbi:olfactory receptor 52B2-like [Carettochelys insculpta]|uniref:olfactory receptor 52B2-like n=1 Tax=Carettochelys insculpta TaxID=44489 RepID=UPI003EBAEC49